VLSRHNIRYLRIRYQSIKCRCLATCWLTCQRRFPRSGPDAKPRAGLADANLATLSTLLGRRAANNGAGETGPALGPPRPLFTNIDHGSSPTPSPRNSGTNRTQSSSREQDHIVPAYLGAELSPANANMLDPVGPLRPGRPVPAPCWFTARSSHHLHTLGTKPTQRSIQVNKV
jgi:hypothetical protein